jgi:hypothetical protein
MHVSRVELMVSVRIPTVLGIATSCGCYDVVIPRWIWVHTAHMATCTPRAEGSIGDTVWRMACHVRHVKWVPGKQQAGCSRPKLTDRPGRPRNPHPIDIDTTNKAGRKGSDPSKPRCGGTVEGRRPSVSTTGRSVAVSLSRPLSCLSEYGLARADATTFLNISPKYTAWGPRRLVHVSTPYAIAAATATLPPAGRGLAVRGD